MLPAKEAETIDEVIQQLKQLIANAMDTDNRIGYFAALYCKVTERIKAAIDKGEFEDDARMERFDVAFANRYLNAVRQYQNGQQPTGPWQVAFDNAKKSSRLVLQHLLLGMNAHINLDLGIAAVRAAGRDPIDTILKDFNAINGILGSMIFEVMQDINRVSKLMSLFGWHATNNSILIQFSIFNARDGAWRFAEDLSQKTGTEADTCIRDRAETIKKLASALVEIKGPIRITVWLIHLFEWKRPWKIIDVLARHEKQYRSFSSTPAPRGIVANAQPIQK